MYYNEQSKFWSFEISMIFVHILIKTQIQSCYSSLLWSIGTFILYLSKLSTFWQNFSVLFFPLEQLQR